MGNHRIFLYFFGNKDVKWAAIFVPVCNNGYWDTVWHQKFLPFSKWVSKHLTSVWPDAVFRRMRKLFDYCGYAAHFRGMKGNDVHTKAALGWAWREEGRVLQAQEALLPLGVGWFLVVGTAMFRQCLTLRKMLGRNKVKKIWILAGLATWLNLIVTIYYYGLSAE